MGIPETIAYLAPLYHVRRPGSNSALARPYVTRLKPLITGKDTETGAQPPRLWVLASPHAGDNTQLTALAGALGWPFEFKRLAYRGSEKFLRLLSLPTLFGLDPEQSDPLSPPWPDLVIAAGRGAESACFWLRKQNPRMRIVFVGTPWAGLNWFDLVIATPQYGLPDRGNVLNNSLPLHAVTPERMASEAMRWQERLAHLPSPRIGVLVGGSSGPYRFSPKAAARLARQASDLATALGGSLLVTTSARSGLPQTASLASHLTAPHYLHRWTGSGENPLFAFLGLADRFIVTADSISMLAEAMATGKPVQMFDIEDGPRAMRAEEKQPAMPGTMPPIHWRGADWEATIFRLLMNHAPRRWSRDLRIVHRHLVKSGSATWLGDPPAAHRPSPDSALSSTVSRVRALFAL